MEISAQWRFERLKGTYLIIVHDGSMNKGMMVWRFYFSVVALFAQVSMMLWEPFWLVRIQDSDGSFCDDLAMWI